MKSTNYLLLMKVLEIKIQKCAEPEAYKPADAEAFKRAKPERNYAKMQRAQPEIRTKCI